MPQLQEYVNRENIAPTDRGTEARVQEGRRVGAAYNQRAESLRDFGNRTAQQIGGAIRDAGNAAVQYQEHRELNQGIDTYWPIRGGLEDDWNDTVKGNPDKGIPPADPHDPAIAQRFMEKAKQKLQDWGDTFHTEGGQNWARGRIDSLIGHFQERTAADMGTVAKQQIDTTIRTTVNTATNSAYNDPSPSNVRHLIEDVKSSIDGMVGSSPHLKGAEAARANNELSEKAIEQIVKAGMMGDIRKSPDPEKTVAERIKDPLYSKYVSGAEADGVAKAAKVQAKVNTATDKAAVQAQRQEANDAAHADAAKNIADNVRVDPATGRVTLKPAYFNSALDIAAKYGDAAPNAAATARELLNWGQHQLAARKETIVSDPAIKSDLYTRIFSADNPTTDVDIFKAETQDKLDRYDAQNLLNLRKAVEDKPLTGPIWRGTIESVKGMLGTDPQGHEAFGKFVSAFIPEYQRMARAGTLPANALDLRDPNSMISQVMAPYRREPQQMFIDRISHGLIAPGELGNVPQGAPPAKGAAPPKQVKSIEDAQKLNPGTRYVTPDGKIFVR